MFSRTSKFFALVFSTLLLLCAMSLQASDTATVLKPNDMKWQDGPNALPPGAKYVLLYGDNTKEGPFGIRLKLPAHYEIPAHFHTLTENITIISGEVNFGMGDVLDKTKSHLYPQGSFVSMPAAMHHFAWTGDKEVIVQLNNMGPWDITYIDPSLDPRHSEGQ